MTTEPAWIPEVPDNDVPAVSRLYDVALGGMHNFTADRALWAEMQHRYPAAALAIRASRAFLGRAVRWLAEKQQIRQILDIGAGLPTQGSVLETAHQINPRIRVACVDLDPVTVIHSRRLLAGNEFAYVRRLDLRDPGSIIYDEQVAEFLDLSQPVAVVLGGVLGFIPDGDHPRSIISTIGEALSPGSFLVLTHTGPDVTVQGRQRQENALRLYERTPTPAVIRDTDQVIALFDDLFELLPPGVTSAARWLPDAAQTDTSTHPTALAVIARRRSASDRTQTPDRRVTSARPAQQTPDQHT